MKTTFVSNTVLHDSHLSLRAKGMFMYLLSLPKDSFLRVDLISKEIPESVSILRKCLKELESKGYINTYIVRNAGKIEGVKFSIREDLKAG